MSRRPKRITALSLFFSAGALISFTSGISLIFPNSFLQPMWRLNPRALDAFNQMGAWAFILLFTVSMACAFSAIGLWQGKLWGYRLAISMLVVNLIGDTYNFLSGIERRAVIGIPIVIVIIFLITNPKTKSFFKKN
jgi:uncharacterized membrane protein (DUF2068 family)